MNSTEFVFDQLAKMGLDLAGYDIHIHDVPLSTILQHGGRHVSRKTAGLAVHCGKRHDIYLLSTLSDTRRKGTLAHELGHVWLQEHRSPLCQSRTENEGFCEVLAYKVYGIIGNIEALAIRSAMLLRRTTVYGEGFHLMKRRAADMGWKDYLQAADGLRKPKKTTATPRFTIRVTTPPKHRFNISTPGTRRFNITTPDTNTFTISTPDTNNKPFTIREL